MPAYDEIPSAELRPEDLPAPDAGWTDVAPFALTFDGYEYVRSLWPDRDSTGACRELAEEVTAAIDRSDSDPTEYSLDDLRAALFWWQRVAHWSGGIAIGGQVIRSDPRILVHCRRLVECIRQRVEAGTQQ